jgi:hypothetical protein
MLSCVLRGSSKPFDTCLKPVLAFARSDYTRFAHKTSHGILPELGSNGLFFSENGESLGNHFFDNCFEHFPALERSKCTLFNALEKYHRANSRSSSFLLLKIKFSQEPSI